MPKVHDTRRQAARELMQLLEAGPSIGGPRQAMLSPREAEQEVRLWLQSWIIPKVRRLVPELRFAAVPKKFEKPEKSS